ncbi:hypothetical protein [Roseateles sp.]|mgnify:CR=1 FL=1|uniref:hypothetical protein n=1 Tax=Roseateles sp. TaxID=1971397 RepID=UPI0039647627
MDGQQAAGRAARILMASIWPAFVMAGVLEGLVFSVIDPQDLHWFGGEAIEWSRSAIYSVSFLIFWLVTTIACSMTALLVQLPEHEEPGRRSAPNWPR